MARPCKRTHEIRYIRGWDSLRPVACQYMALHRCGQKQTNIIFKRIILLVPIQRLCNRIDPRIYMYIGNNSLNQDNGDNLGHVT